MQLRSKVTGFFHRLVEPALQEIGQAPDEG